MQQAREKNLEIIKEQAKEELLAQIERSLEKKLPAHFRVYKKILDVEQLPKRSECLRLMRKVDAKFGAAVYGELLAKHGYFQIIHEKLVSEVARLAKKLNSQGTIEICAGMGKLSYWLNLNGVEIVATDSWERVKSNYVNKMSYTDALKKYRPKTVIAAWPEPQGFGLVKKVLEHPTVENFIIIGKGGYIARKYEKQIAKYGKVIPLDLTTSPSRVDSMISSPEYGPKVAETIIKLFQVGRSGELHQSVLIETIRK